MYTLKVQIYSVINLFEFHYIYSFNFPKTLSVKMDTLTLEHILKKIAQSYRRKFRANIITKVLPCDKLSTLHKVLKRQKKSAVALIVNTDTSDKPGSHWESIFIPAEKKFNQSRTCFFFDSYGHPPNNKFIKDFIKSSSKISKWSIQQLQGYNSVICGEWCCLFLLSMTKGCSFPSFFKQFSRKNFEANDVEALKFFDKIFSTNQIPKTILQSCCKYSDCMNKNK